MPRLWLGARLVAVLGVGVLLAWTSHKPLHAAPTPVDESSWTVMLDPDVKTQQPPPPAITQQLAQDSSAVFGCSNAHATTALWLARLPAFPVRCRSDLVQLYKQIVFSPGSPLLERTGAVGLVQAEGKETPRAEQGHVPHLVRNMFADDMSWLPPGTRRLPLSCNGCVQDAMHWLHFGSNIHNESALYLALGTWYAALPPGGLLSGSNFLDRENKRHPLINTAGKADNYRKGTPLFKHKRQDEYLHRLDTTAHAVRSAVKRFAREHDLLIYVTYVYDCSDEPTWYIVKPASPKNLVAALVGQQRRSAQLGFCKDYELHTSDIPLSRDVIASLKSCSAHSKFQDIAQRLVRTDSFPLQCRDDLLVLASELGLNGSAVEVGNGTGVKFDLLDPEVANVWRNTARLHKSMEDPAIDGHEREKRDADKKSKKKGPRLDQRLRPTLPDRLTGFDGAASHLDWFLALARAGTAAQISSADDAANDSLDWVHITDHLPTRRAITKDLKAWWPKLRSGGIISGDDFIDRCDKRRPLDSNSVTFNGAYEDHTVYQQRPSTGGYGVRRAVKDWAGSQALVPISVTYMYDCYAEPVWYAVKP